MKHQLLTKNARGCGLSIRQNSCIESDIGLTGVGRSDLRGSAMIGCRQIFGVEAFSRKVWWVGLDGLSRPAGGDQRDGRFSGFAASMMVGWSASFPLDV